MDDERKSEIQGELENFRNDMNRVSGNFLTQGLDALENPEILESLDNLFRTRNRAPQIIADVLREKMENGKTENRTKKD